MAHTDVTVVGSQSVSLALSTVTAVATVGAPTLSAGTGGATTPTRLFADTSRWNTAKVDGTHYSGFDTGSSVSLISTATWGINNGSYSHPMYFGSTSDTTTYTITLGAGWGWPATTVTFLGPAGMTPASGSDGVMTVLLANGGTSSVDINTMGYHTSWPAGTLLDMYKVTGTGTTLTAKTYGLSSAYSGPGFGYDASPQHAIGTCVAGAPQAAGTILAQDVASTSIPHALFVAADGFSTPYLLGNGLTGSYKTPPALNYDIGTATGPIPEGALLLIPSTTPKPSGLTAMGSAMWDAAQTYGAYVCDRLGGHPQFYGDRSSGMPTSTDCTTVGQALRVAITW